MFCRLLYVPLCLYLIRIFSALWNLSPQGITFQDFYIKCREQFLVNSDATLRTQLTEFKDHMLIKTRSVDGSEVLYIPVEQQILQQFLESEF